MINYRAQRQVLSESWSNGEWVLMRLTNTCCESALGRNARLKELGRLGPTQERKMIIFIEAGAFNVLQMIDKKGQLAIII